MRRAGEMTGVLQHGEEKLLGARGGRLAATAAGLGLLGYGGYRALWKEDPATQEQKTSALYAAAVYGKQALMQKLAEDAINPARISAGPAPAFSGEVMPSAASPVFGGATSAEQLVAMKAQKVRDRINSEMRAYVAQTGDGYNLDGYLSTFNR